jgi:metal-responsive CopG/Arc/MetJ family transcriptional regulator
MNLGGGMSIAKIAVSIDADQLKKIDFYVKKHVFKTRSEAIRIAINQTLDELEHNRLAKECAKLEISEEQEMANMGLDEDLDAWPEY